MSDDAFGACDKPSGTAVVPDGSYSAEVASITIVGEDQRSGKSRVRVMFRIIGGEHDGKALPRTMSIAFGKVKDSAKWATFAEMIEAVTGVACGDPEQKALKSSDVVGKRCQITVLENSKGYADIVRFKAARVAPDDTTDRTHDGIIGGTAQAIIAFASVQGLRGAAFINVCSRASKGRTESLLGLTEPEGQKILAWLETRKASAA